MINLFNRKRLYSAFFIAVTALLLFPPCIQAQTPTFIWASKGSGDGGSGFFPYVRMTADKAGNTYTVGSFYTPQLAFDKDTLNQSTSGYATLFVVKFDPDGKELWAIQTQGFMYSGGNYITWNETTNKLYITGTGACKYNPNNSGNYLNAYLGSHTFPGHPNGLSFMAELDAQTGSVGWVKEFSGYISFTTITAYGHNLYTGGTFNGSVYSYSTYTYVDSILSFGNGITLTNQSDYGNSSVFIAKYDDQGNAKWVVPSTVQCGGSNRQPTLTSITTDNNGQPIAFGNIESCIILDHDTINYAHHWMYTAKYDTAGNLLWHRENGAVPVGPGSGFNEAKEVVCDHNNNVIITGVYFYTLYWGKDTLKSYTGNNQTFLVKYDQNGNELWALDPGSAQFNNDYGGPGIAVDGGNNIYLTMQYELKPVTLGNTTITPISGNYGGTRDILVAKFDPNGQPVWLKSAGGVNDEWGCDVVTDSSDNVYISGYTASPDMHFDTYVVSSSQSYSIFVAKIGPIVPPNKAQFAADRTVICEKSSVIFTDQSTGTPTGWKWTFAGGTPATSTAQNPTVTYNNSGNYSVKLVATFANSSDSLTKTTYITVQQKPIAGTLSATDDTICAGETSALHLSGSSTGTLQWQLSANNSNFSGISGVDSTGYSAAPGQSTYFRVINTIGGCADTTGPILLKVNPAPATPVVTAADSIICSSDSTLVSSSGSFAAYNWNNGDKRAFTYAKQAGNYWVTATDANGCSAVSNNAGVKIYSVPSVSIVVTGDTLSSLNFNQYQWYRNGSKIDGATSPVYIADQPGDYAVEVTDLNGCNTLSSSIATGINDIAGDITLSVYPNPASTFLNIRYDSSISQSAYYTLLNTVGQQVISGKLMAGGGQTKNTETGKE